MVVPAGVNALAVAKLGAITSSFIEERRLARLSNIHLVAPACVGVVIDGPAFWTSAIRGLVTSVRLVSPRTFDLRIHAHPEELLTWFPPMEHARRTGTTLHPLGFRQCLEQAQAWIAEVPVCMIMGPGNGRFLQAQGTT
jgi:hypothetical protein